MENQNNTLNSDSKDIKDTKIYWKKIILDIWAIRKRLYKAAAIGLVLGLIIAFSIPKQYSVSVTLAPEMGNNKNGGGLASLASSFLGGGIATTSSDALNVLQAPRIVSSTPFLLDLLKSKVVNEEIDIDTTFIAYLENEKEPWWKFITGLPGYLIKGIKSLFIHEKNRGKELYLTGPIKLSTKENRTISNLRKKITVTVAKNTGIINISVSLQDPVITAIIADSVVSKLQKEIIKYRISKAENDVLYWQTIYVENKESYYKAQQKYAQYIDSNSNVILQSVLVESERLRNEMTLAFQMYTQVSQQLQMAQAKIQESKPAFVVIEPSVIPQNPISMGKLQLMVIFMILSLGIVIAWELKGKSLFKSLFDF